jgi:lipoprotein NlpI
LAYYARGLAYSARAQAGDLDQAIADYTQAVTLDPNNAVAYNNRGLAYGQRAQAGDLDQAVADYTQTITLDPTNRAAYFGRALVHLFAGSLPRALVDLDRSSQLDPKNPYAAIWLDIVDKRSNLPSKLAQAVTQIDMSKWPAPIIHLYLDQMMPDAVLAAADDPDGETKKGRICEANFYIGELSLQQGKKAEAVRRFRLAAADCPRSFAEWGGARAELRALGESP